MAKNASLYIRTDQETKDNAEALFSSFGITVTDAVNMFLKKSIMVHGLPFELRQEIPNTETIAAMEEADRISRDPSVKAYSDVDEMMRELLAH